MLLPYREYVPFLGICVERNPQFLFEFSADFTLPMLLKSLLYPCYSLQWSAYFVLHVFALWSAVLRRDLQVW